MMAEGGRKNWGGRPKRKPEPGERVHLGLRVTPDMKARLEQAAGDKGRSLSQETEFRLEQSLAGESALGGARVYGLAQTVAMAMKAAGEMGALLSRQPFKDGTWMEHPYAYDQAAKAAIQMLEFWRPPGEITVPDIAPKAAQRMRDIAPRDAQEAVATLTENLDQLGQMIVDYMNRARLDEAKAIREAVREVVRATLKPKPPEAQPQLPDSFARTDDELGASISESLATAAATPEQLSDPKSLIAVTRQQAADHRRLADQFDAIADKAELLDKASDDQNTAEHRRNVKKESAK